MILGMLAVADKRIVENHIDTMLKVGFGKQGTVSLLSSANSPRAVDIIPSQRDFQLVRYSCIALQRLSGSTKKVKGSLKDDTVRYSMDHPIFAVLAKAIQKPTRNLDWFQMAEHIINTVYALGTDPAQWAQKVLQSLVEKAFTTTGSVDEDQDMDDTEVKAAAQDNADTSDEQKDGESRAGLDRGDADMSISQTASNFTQVSQNVKNGKGVTDTFQLSQLLSVVGHVGLKQLVFLETIEREWKRQKDEKLAGKKNRSEPEPTQIILYGI